MGLVLTIIMTLALVMVFAPCPLQQRVTKQGWQQFDILLILGGYWNFFWHGLRHPLEFWGQAALVSGFCLILIGLARLEPMPANGSVISFFNQLSLLDQRLNPILGFVIALCWLLYTITLIQLKCRLRSPATDTDPVTTRPGVHPVRICSAQL